MKILSGQFKGRPIDQPKTRAVRPLSEKVRAALFDVVGAPTGLTVLDAYAGSGAAGFEAASRGAVLVNKWRLLTIRINDKICQANWLAR